MTPSYSLLILDFFSIFIGLFASWSCYKDGLKATSLAFAIFTVIETIQLAIQISYGVK
jgi:hypothetical protein